MPKQTINDTELRIKLASVFREFGYEGASVAQFTKATGLQRSSLYHRFPGGKEEMALEVLKFVDEIFVNEILAPLSQKGALNKRVRQVATSIGEFYADGTRWCLLETLSLATQVSTIQAHLQSTMQVLLDSLTMAAVEGGASEKVAKLRAKQVVIQLEGTLVLSRVCGTTSEFSGFVDQIPVILLGEEQT